MIREISSLLIVMAVMAGLCGLATAQAGADSEVTIEQVEINPDGAYLAARYQIIFTTGASGALKAGEDAIYITFPEETLLPSTIKGNSVIVNGKRCAQEGDVFVYDQTVVVYPGVDIDENSQCTVVISQSANVVNPRLSEEIGDNAVTRLYTLEVKTDKDEADTYEYEISDWVGVHPWKLAQHDPCTVWGAGFKPGYTIHLNGLSGGPVHGSGKVGADGTFEFVGYATGRTDELLIASEGSGRSARATENAPHLPENQPPSASFNYTPQEPVINQTVTFDGSGSTDSDGIITAWSWNFGDGAKGSGETVQHSYAAPGDHTVTLTVTDNRNTTDTENSTLSIQPPDKTSVNNPPVASAGAPRTVEQTGPNGAKVTLDGSGSYDPDGDALMYNWSWDAGLASGVRPAISLPPGETSITLTVSDGEKSDSDITVITVADSTPPQVMISSPVDGEIYPVTERSISLEYNVTDKCDPEPYVTIELNGNEFIGNQIDIRDMRAGEHTLTITATDKSGNSSSVSTSFSIRAETPGNIKGNLWNYLLAFLKYIMFLFGP
ncbi:MAG: PKD domain-containing protein [Dehalococcoidia bacterium]